jgi:16S rRNA (guanine527-N7)-methyltransferase
MMMGLDSLDVSRETIAELEAFRDLVLRWNPHINLIAKSDAASIWNRHILDSVQLMALAPTMAQPTAWLDIGSGGGFPAIVLAILSRTRRPDDRFTLVESDQRKASFLRTVSRELRLGLRVEAARAESLAPEVAGILTARALAPLAELLPLTERHLHSAGLAIFPKGRRAAEEIAAARLDWSFDLALHPSMTDPNGRILCLTHIKRNPRA